MTIPNADLCPPGVKATIDRWVEVACPTGSFVEAVLENNLKEAFGRADHENIAAMPHIVAYCYNRIPQACWGSRENVSEWSASGGLAGLRAMG